MRGVVAQKADNTDSIVDSPDVYKECIEFIVYRSKSVMRLGGIRNRTKSHESKQRQTTTTKKSVD